MANTVLVRRACTVLVSGAAVLALSAAPGTAAPGEGYVRLAHLSPDTPAVDVYLYTAGKKTPRLVLRHVGYGVLSPYQRLGGGRYTVAMRPADAPASSKPVLSTNVRVRGGASYTVAGMGPYKGIKLDVLDDTVDLPAGRAGLRLIAASLKQPGLKVTAGGTDIAPGLRFGTATPYREMAPGALKVRATGAKDAAVSAKVALTAGSAHTVIVLDGPKGLRLLDLRDVGRGAVPPPRGGVDTGLGGMAGNGSPSPWWPAALAAPFALAAVALLRRRRTR